MEPQRQSHPNWNTRGRRATIFPQREGVKTLLPSPLPAQHEETFYETPRYRTFLSRKRALCDFRVRWPELVYRDQEAQAELPSLDRKPVDTSSCSSGVSISLKNQESSHSEFQDPQELTGCLSEAPHVTILNSYLKPESMTRLEKKVRRRTLVVMNQLEQEKEAAKFRRAVLLRDTRTLQDENAFEKAENKPFLEFLTKKNQETQEKYDALWKDYIQQCQEIEDRRRELVSTFTSRTTDLQKKLVENKKLEASLKKKLRALEPIARIKESQDWQIRALELEKASIVADIPLMDREAHFQFLKERAALEKQVEDLNLLESGEDITRELKKKTKAWETVARQAHEDFCHDVNARNRQLRTQLRELDWEFCKLEARRERLELRKQRWKEQQWYLEALARGRERLQQREHRRQQREHHRQQQEHHQQQQGRPALDHCLLGTRSKANPK
ncbi:coiled-coil domain-containing protein 121-like [Apodemus sylvaticus]|uniref:coiled-coil domain-containing protein 121-like n=1 Tax=Apodemus sylvaticus TaxID=10129 RepID=UPI0022433552|nr:coiled-coil domain-containing protein 121-like [Apodemus sylvaticus]